MVLHVIGVVMLLLTGTTLAAKPIPSFAGPYILYFDKLAACNDDDTGWREMYGSLRVSHFNPAKPHQPQNLTGSLKLHINLDDSYLLNVLVHKRSNNQWKRNYFVFRHFPVGACSALRNNAPGAFGKAFNIKPTGRCFVPKGTYTFDHLPVSWDLPNFPQLPYGHFFINLTSDRLQDRKLTGTMVCAEANIIPKP